VTRVAAIDCGTNSVRLLVADASDGHLHDVVRRMEIVRLGQGVDRTGRLAADALARTRTALADYAAQLRALGVRRVRMVATSATRDASNADDFRAMVVETVGVTPEVVTGDEEARLSFTGAVRGLPHDLPPPFLVVDIGGGSTELVLGRPAPADTAGSVDAARSVDAAGSVDAAVSVDVGCVRMTERHLHGDPPTAAEVTDAEADVAAALDRALEVVPGRDAATLVGLAGSVTTVTAIALGLPSYQPERIHHARVGYREVANVTGELLGMTRAQRLAVPAMHPGRVDVIGAGALVLRVVMETVGATSVVASEHDILDGIALSLANGRGQLLRS
jgi:exopolyphosphatase / guanosine-5'-triphosphate,3'-diphosphate pyrophosphatase